MTAGLGQLSPTELPSYRFKKIVRWVRGGNKVKSELFSAGVQKCWPSLTVVNPVVEGELQETHKSNT